MARRETSTTSPGPKSSTAKSSSASAKGKRAAASAPLVVEPDVVEPDVVEPDVVEPDDERDGDEGGDDELAALDPRALEDEDDSDGDGDGDVLDVSPGPGGGLVKRTAIALPEGEWILPEGLSDGPTAADAAIAEDEHVPTASRGDDLYAAFVREATKLQRLSEEEERALGLKVRDQQDQRAAKKLVVHNLRLAIKMAHQYRRTWTNLMDLVQEASAGMAIAAQRWDPDQGTRFGTYAVYWIRAQLTKFLMTHGRAIHTGNTRAGRKLYFQLPRVRRKLLAEGKEPSVENIAKEVQEDPAEVARIVSRLDGREASLDAQVGPDDDGSTLGEMISDDEERDPEENAARAEVSKLITQVMQRFAASLDNERDKAIWTEHLVASEPKSLVELGARFGVSKQRMGQLATRLKRAFRRHVIDELGPQTQLSWLFSQD